MNIQKWGNIALRDKANKILLNIDSHGYVAQLGKFIDEYDYKYYEFETNKNNNTIKGAIDETNKRIFVNSDLANDAKHFTLAHEIAHAVLHPADNQHIYYRKPLQEKDSEHIESEANVLAYELVMPLEKFKEAYIKYSANIEKLSKEFFVPIVQVEKRIVFLKQQIQDKIIKDFMSLND
jgi:Zn-dependent peptidase ImmA (M78 family)